MDIYLYDAFLTDATVWIYAIGAVGFLLLIMVWIYTKRFNLRNKDKIRVIESAWKDVELHTSRKALLIAQYLGKEMNRSEYERQLKLIQYDLDKALDTWNKLGSA